jgi:hypothetical protein
MLSYKIQVYETPIDELEEGNVYLFYLSRSTFNTEVFELTFSNSYDSPEIKHQLQDKSHKSRSIILDQDDSLLRLPQL